MKVYRVNIRRPIPDSMKKIPSKENQRLCEYIEPLRKSEKVFVSSAYGFNLNQYRQGEDCSYSPGFKYFFWFTNKEDAERFIIDWDELAVKEEHYSEQLREKYKDNFTSIIEEERE